VAAIMSKPRIIEGSLADGGRIVEDRWTEIDTAEGLHLAAEGVPLFVPHALWTSERDALIARNVPIAVKLENTDDPASLVDDLARFSMIAIHFPKFTDGRGYSIARLLRERYGYTGPLRAVGDVLRDQMFYMLRCGFDSFAMKHEELIEGALTAYRDFTEAYQTSVDRKLPLFARREPAQAKGSNA
jgi:uncharacterized protein (DUF934 family)